ncbi:MAG: ACT domain-containing protein [Ruminococcaceae bacterium]|nr:ACT domain-containing protein [Oscillospiraceae bacterium]
MKAIISVIGKDTYGILAKVSAVCADCKANIMDVTQSVLQDMFVMIMLVDISEYGCDFANLREKMDALGNEIGMKISVMHEDIFNSMHKI